MKNAQNRDELGVTSTVDSTATNMQKPVAPPVNFDQIPEALASLPFFVLWRYEWKDGRWTKPPRQANGRFAKSNDPSTQTTLDEARAAYEDGKLDGKFDGIGIVLRDGLCGIDLDHVRSPDGAIEPWAQEILTRFAGTYIERSPGGDGFHILCTGTPARTGKQGPNNYLEIYDESSKRYFTLTGQRHDQ